MEKPLIIAVANRKGGTGKTTTAVNLAYFWAERGISTLLVDMDSQGHAGIGVGVHPARGREGLHRIFQVRDYKLGQAVVSTLIPNLFLLPACPEYDGGGLGGDYGALSRGLAAGLEHRFDRIILDTPPTLDHVLMNALAAAHGILVPFQPHHLAEVGVRQLAGLFYRIASRQNRGLRLLGLLPVMLDERMNLHRQVVGRLAKEFGAHKMLSGIRGNIRLAEAFAHGLPVGLYAPGSPGERDYRRLVDEFEKLLPDQLQWSVVHEEHIAGR